MNIYLRTLTFAIFFLAISLIAKSQLLINEYSAANISTITDNYGSYEDWFELYNAGSSTITLSGYYVSDKASNPTKWQITSGTITPGGFARFFASGRDVIIGTNYHTNFKLLQTKPDILMLSDASGIMIDSIHLRHHQPDHSWGRTTNGASTWSVFSTPTPNVTNNNQTPYNRYALQCNMSIPAGFYPSSQNITLTTTEPGATIRYTVDGSVPTTASASYSAPINIATTTVLKTIVYSTDASVLPSFYTFDTYFINVSHTVSVASVSGNEILNLINGGWGLNPVTSIEYFTPDLVRQFATVGRSDKHGNDSWAYPQRGIDYVAWDQYGYNHYMNYKIFDEKDRTKFQRVIFKAAASDNYDMGPQNACHLRDAFVQSYSQHIGLNIDCRTNKSCVLFVNGQYWGLYEIREKVDDGDYTEYYYDQPAEDIDVLKFWGGLQVDYGTDTGWVNLYNYIMANPMTNQPAYNYVKSKLSFSNFIDYCIYNTYIVNTDWINWNTFWWRGNNPNGGHKKWHYALWDQDNTWNLGQNYSGWQTTTFTADPCDLANNFQNAGPNMGSMDVLTALMTNAEFKQLYISRYADLMNGHLSCDSVQNFLQNYIDIITPEMPKQIARWTGSMAGWQTNLQLIKDQIDGRCAYIAGSIVDCYDVTGPYNLTVIVEPAGSGKVIIGTVTPQAYPYDGTYFGTVNLHIEEVANPDYVFGYWIPGNSTTLTPNFLSDTLSLLLTGNDTLIAHFKYWPLINSTEDIDGFSYAIFPNITNDNVVVDYKNLKANDVSCKIFSLTGNELYDISNQFNNNDGRIIINFKDINLSTGMYFIEMKSGTFRKTSKVIFQAH